MATVWVVEGSQTVQRMIEIALADLPIQLVLASQASQLIAQGHEEPVLLICAQRLGPQTQSNQNAYQVQIQQIMDAGYRCPLILLLDQQAMPITETPALTLMGCVRKPFKTQKLIEIVAQSLQLYVPHAEHFDESRRVIPLARSSNSSVSTHPLKSQSSIDQVVTSRHAKVKTPSPSSVGSLLDAVTPVQQRPTSPLSSSELVTRKPQESQVDSASDFVEQKVEPSPHDLSPFPTTEKDQQDHSLATPTTPESLQRPQFDFSSTQPTASQVSSSGPEERHRSDEIADISTGARDQTFSTSSTPVPESTADQSTADQISLRGDWLDQPQTSPIPTSQQDDLETAIDLAPLSKSEIATPTPRHLTSRAVASEVYNTAFETVRATTERALSLAQRVNRQHAERLTPEEMRVLIERVAWEVVPAIATELIRAEMTKNLPDQVKS